jgi:hypothetical protein
MRELDAVAEILRRRLKPQGTLPCSDAPRGVGNRPRRGAEVGPGIGSAWFGSRRRNEGFACGDEVVALICIDAPIERLTG